MTTTKDTTIPMLSSSESKEESAIERAKRKRREAQRRYYSKHKEKCIERTMLCYYKNREKRIEYAKKYSKKHRKNYEEFRRKTDPLYRLKKNLRTRIYLSLKENTKSKSMMKLLGCTAEELWAHLESQFKPGMTRDNYGSWHVDHIIPCVKFDLSKEENQKMCFHYSNLQPLWAEENISKRDKII